MANPPSVAPDAAIVTAAMARRDTDFRNGFYENVSIKAVVLGIEQANRLTVLTPSQAACLPLMWEA